MDQTIKDFWENDNLKNIKPTSTEFPEGFDPRCVLKEITADITFSSIVDFGCGYGRLCEAWDNTKYTGIDISEIAVNEAIKKNPTYVFKNYSTPAADLYVAYTVFLHLSNDQLKKELRAIQTKYFIIAEILGSEWSNNGKGNPPTYNRDDYDIMKEFGFEMIKEVRRPYARYVNHKMAKGKNTDISFLLWGHNEIFI